MYSDWERYLHDYAKRRGLPPEYIDMGFWRWKVLPPKMRQLAEGFWRDSMAGGKHLLGMPRGRHVFGTVKVGERGQIVIPKEARELFGIRPGDTLLVLGDEKNGLLVTPPDVMHDVARQIFQNLEEEENQK